MTKYFKYFFLLTLGVATIGLQSCDDDDDDRINAPRELQNALAERYPDAQRVEWETEGSFYVADFFYNNCEAEAWFTRDAVWQLTETDLPYNRLPAAVQTAFQNSTYANWRIEDVDMVERNGMETFYVIEAEMGEQDVDLHYSEDGILIKEITDGAGNAGNYWPPTQPDNTLTTTVRNYIAEHYPNARIIEMDTEMGRIEVDIIHDYRNKDVTFDTQGNWLSTSWDVRINELPQAVSQAAQAAYPDYFIDDADFVETPDGNYYLIEMENRTGFDVYLQVTEQGQVLN